HFVIAFGLLLIPVSFLGKFSASTIPFLLGANAMLLLFTIGVNLLTSALDVRFRDINFFVQAVLILWFYATPVIYSFTQIPRDILWLWRFNPLTSILQLYQHALLAAPEPGP